MAKSSKISKVKAVDLVTELLLQGKSRKEILLIIANTYKVSDKTVDNWLKEARPVVEARLKEDELIRSRVSATAVEDAANEANITKQRVIQRLAQIAFGDIRNVFTVDGGLRQISDWDDETAGMIAGIESFDEKARDTGETLGTNRKVKTLSPLDAITILNKMLGYNLPDKVAQTDPQGNALVWNETKTYGSHA